MLCIINNSCIFIVLFGPNGVGVALTYKGNAFFIPVQMYLLFILILNSGLRYKKTSADPRSFYLFHIVLCTG